VTEDVRDIDSAAPEPEPDPEAELETDLDADPEADPEADEPEADSPAPAARVRLSVPPRVRRIGAAVLVALLVISGGVATWLYFKQYRPDQQTDSSVARSVARAASEGTTALLSYSADTLDQDFAAAKSHLGGDFLSYYDQFSRQTVAPMAKQKSMKTTAKVTGAAVSELQPDSAVVLVFVDQVTTTKDNPRPAVAVTSVLVRMSRIGGNWLITKFSPV
jgi:Mce-associated membrane protein